MKKLLITGLVVAGAIIVTGGTYATVTADTCNYHPKTGNYHVNGKIYAMGTWDHALACAKEGKLPQKVADRICVWGSKEDQEIGRQAAKLNAEVKRAREEAAKNAAAEAKKEN